MSVCLTCALAVIECLTYLLGSLGCLTPLTLSAGLALVALVVWRTAPPPQQAESAQPQSESDLWFFFASRVGVVLFVVLALQQFETALFIPPQNWDSWTYHLEFPAAWLNIHSLATPTRQYGDPYPTFAPLNAEILNYFLLAPLRTDFIAKHGSGLAALYALVTVHASAMRLGTTPHQATGLTMTAGLSGLVLSSFGDSGNDMLAGATWIACLHAALLYSADPSRATQVFGALTYSLMLGVKYTLLAFQAPLALVWLAAVVMARGRAPAAAAQPFRRLSRLGLTTLLVLGCGLLPYFRNFLLASNPVYPMEVSVAGVPLLYGIHRQPVPHERLAAYAARDLIKLETIRDLGPSTYLSLAAAVLVLLATGPRRDRRWPNAFVALAPPALLLSYHFILPHHNLRYLTPLVMAAGVASATLVTLLPVHLGDILTGALLAVSLWPASALAEWQVNPATRQWLGDSAPLILGSLVFAFIVIHTVGRQDTPMRGVRPLHFQEASLLAAGLLGAMALHRAERIYIPHRPGHWPRLEQTWFRATWSKVEALTREQPTVIAYVGNNIPYALRGPRLGNLLVGIPRGPERNSAFFGFGYDFPAPREKPSPEDWLLNLAECERLFRRPVKFMVISVLYPQEMWPYEYYWAEDRPDLFRRIWQEGGSCIYEIRPH